MTTAPFPTAGDNFKTLGRLDHGSVAVFSQSPQDFGPRDRSGGSRPGLLAVASTPTPTSEAAEDSRVGDLDLDAATGQERR